MLISRKFVGRCLPHLLAGVFDPQNRFGPSSLLAKIDSERGTCWQSSALSPQSSAKATAKPFDADERRLTLIFRKICGEMPTPLAGRCFWPQNRFEPASLLAKIDSERGTCWSSSQFSGEARSLWPLKSRAMGYLQQVGGALKTTLIAAYLAGKVEVGVGTCWSSSQFSVLSSQGDAITLAAQVLGDGVFAASGWSPKNNANCRVFGGESRGRGGDLLEVLVPVLSPQNPASQMSFQRTSRAKSPAFLNA